jgi:hypothetical protein
MIVREIRQHEYPDADFGAERENTFFLSSSQEVRLRCRYNSTQRRTYVNERDYLKLALKQQAAFQANALNPRCFYCGADAVVHAPVAPTAKAARKSMVEKLAETPGKSPRRRGGAKTKGGGRGFNWDSELGEFIVMELTNLDGYTLKETACGVKVFGVAAGRYLDKHELRTLRRQLELDRGDEAVRSASCIRLRVA